MTVYNYYAVIELTDENNYIVTFPDVEGCFSQGSTLLEAVEMAEEALGLMLVDYEDEGNMPPVSTVESIKVPQGASLVMIQTDTDNFRDDAEVIISPSKNNDNKYSLQFDMAKDTVDAVQAEVKELKEKTNIVTFSNFMENAVLFYLDSEQWQRAKKGFLDMDTEDDD